MTRGTQECIKASGGIGNRGHKRGYCVCLASTRRSRHLRCTNSTSDARIISPVGWGTNLYAKGWLRSDRSSVRGRAALRDFVVHSTRAAWVDGRGSASGDRYTSVAGPGEGAVAVPLLRCQRRLVTEFLLTIIVGTYVIIPVVWPEPYVDC